MNEDQHPEGLVITNDKGRKFLVRTVRRGERYGLNDCLVHGAGQYDIGDDPMIEFYDLTHATPEESATKFGPRGQFVSRYYASTLGADDRLLITGLCLDGGNADVWSVNGAALVPVLELAKQIGRPDLWPNLRRR